jgi:hypothetical protein
MPIYPFVIIAALIVGIAIVPPLVAALLEARRGPRD